MHISFTIDSLTKHQYRQPILATVRVHSLALPCHLVYSVIQEVTQAIIPVSGTLGYAVVYYYYYYYYGARVAQR